MINTALLRKKIKDSGHGFCCIAKRCGLTYQEFKEKLNGETEFMASEIMMLKEILNISDNEVELIFFSGYVDS